MTEHQRYGKHARRLYRILIVICTLALIVAIVVYYIFSEKGNGNPVSEPSVPVDAEAIENGIHLRTGLKVATGYREVINNCTTCHSASLLVQNRMDAKGWKATIKWMQQTQNLWDLGEKEETIIKYLVSNYPVENKGRRQPLEEIDWYLLDGK